jgi:hypothetical protein
MGERGLGRGLPALAHDPQDPVSALVGERLDVAGEHLGDAQAVVDEQAHERRRPPAVGLGGGKQFVELLGGEADGGGVVGDLGPAHVGDRRVLEGLGVLDAVVVELRQARQAPSNRGRRGRPSGRRLVDLAEVADPGVDVVAPGGQGMNARRRAPAVPGLEVAE